MSSKRKADRDPSGVDDVCLRRCKLSHECRVCKTMACLKHTDANICSCCRYLVCSECVRAVDWSPSLCCKICADRAANRDKSETKKPDADQPSEEEAAKPNADQPSDAEAEKPSAGQSNDDEWLVAHTDGSSLKNGRKGAQAGSGFCLSDGREWHGVCPGKQTNQRAELYAAVQALQQTRDANRLRIVSDSEYVILGVNDETRLQQWRRNGWRTKSGSNAAHRDLWQSLADELDARSSRKQQTEFAWTKAHNGNKHNERADALAKQGAKRRRL